VFRQTLAFKTVLLAAISCVAVFAVSCSKSGQPPSNSSAPAPSAASSAGGEFEGTIAMKMETENQPGGMEMTYFLKGRHTRIESKVPNVPGGEAVMLWDLEGGKMTTLMPSRKSYITMDLQKNAEAMREAAKGMKKSSGDEDEKFPKLTPTGKQETIAGYTCEHWLMGDKQDLDMCVAKGLGYFGMGGQSGGGLGASLKNLAFSPKLLAEAATHPEWVKLLEGGAFPLRITSMEDGKVKMNIEATRIEKKSLDDSLFTIPPDYKELSMRNAEVGGPNLTGGKQ
jgi:Domain of unknown function (DUF4412)